MAVMGERVSSAQIQFKSSPFGPSGRPGGIPEMRELQSAKLNRGRLILKALPRSVICYAQIISSAAEQRELDQHFRCRTGSQYK